MEAQTDSTAGNETAHQRLLQTLLERAGVCKQTRLVFRDIDMGRIVDAFACVKCAHPGGHALCLADQIEHRRNRQLSDPHDDGSDEDDEDKDEDDDQAIQNETDDGRGPTVLLASAGYNDHSLMGTCLRAIVPAGVVCSIVNTVLFANDLDATPHVRVCADRAMIVSKGDRPPLRLCRPPERDCLRLRAWAWLDSIARQHDKRWRSDAYATGPCWEAVARPCDVPSKALMLWIARDVAYGYVRQICAVGLALEIQAREDAVARGTGRFKRIECPYDARIVGFVQAPFWSDYPTVCYVHIVGDTTFAIHAEWKSQRPTTDEERKE